MLNEIKVVLVCTPKSRDNANIIELIVMDIFIIQII